ALPLALGWRGGNDDRLNRWRRLGFGLRRRLGCGWLGRGWLGRRGLRLGRQGRRRNVDRRRWLDRHRCDLCLRPGRWFRTGFGRRARRGARLLDRVEDVVALAAERIGGRRTCVVRWRGGGGIGDGLGAPAG